MNWPVIWGVIKFDAFGHIVVPDNYFADDRISVRFSKDKTFDPAASFGYETLNLNKNEISFEIMCSRWRPDDLHDNEEEWCTSDMEYFSPDEIELEQKQQFSKVSDFFFIRADDTAKKKFVYTFDMLHDRLKNLQKVMTDIINLPNINEVLFYITDSHGDIRINEHEFLDWQVDEFADKYLTLSSELIESGYFNDTLSSYYFIYKRQY